MNSTLKENTMLVLRLKNHNVIANLLYPDLNDTHAGLQLSPIEMRRQNLQTAKPKSLKSMIKCHAHDLFTSKKYSY